MTDTRTNIAMKLKQVLIDSSPLIEAYTTTTCPDCLDVCCRQRHGLYSERDIAYLNGLGMAIPPRDEARSLDGPCESMGPQGCTQPRWMRPFKCTWYFCDSLLAALDNGPQKKARKLARMIQDMITLRNTVGHSCGGAGTIAIFHSEIKVPASTTHSTKERT